MNLTIHLHLVPRSRKVELYFLTDFMKLNPSSEAASCALAQEFPNILWKPNVYYRAQRSPPLISTLNCRQFSYYSYLSIAHDGTCMRNCCLVYSVGFFVRVLCGSKKSEQIKGKSCLLVHMFHPPKFYDEIPQKLMLAGESRSCPTNMTSSTYITFNTQLNQPLSLFSIKE
jgi:hypothetical protein